MTTLNSSIVGSTSRSLERYNNLFDSTRYNHTAELLASNLNADRDDTAVADGLVLLQDAALELCRYPGLRGTCLKLAIYCGQNSLSRHTVDAMRDFLHLFAADDVRVDDFEATAIAMLRAFSALDDLNTATASANGIHSWQGRMAYQLLAAAEYIIRSALALLGQQQADEGYGREKLRSGLERITGALYEGTRHSLTPRLWDLRSTSFPSVDDRSSDR